MKPTLNVMAIAPSIENISTIMLIFFNHTNIVSMEYDINGNILINDKKILETSDKRKRKKYIQKSRKIFKLVYSDNFVNGLKRLQKIILVKNNTDTVNLQKNLDYINAILNSDVFTINDCKKLSLNIRQSRFYNKCSDGERFIFSKKSLQSIYQEYYLFQDIDF